MDKTRKSELLFLDIRYLHNILNACNLLEINMPINKIFYAIPLFALLLLPACVSPGGGGGLLMNSAVSPLIITDNPVGTRVGQSTARCFLAIACFGDAGIYRAAKNGNIKKISTVDYRYNSFLFFVYNSTTTIVSGE